MFNKTMPRLTGLFLLCLFLGCGADYLDINDNPNSATEPPLDGLLATVTYNSAQNQYETSFGHAANFVQYLASPNEANTTDTYLEVSNSGAWEDIYGTLTDLHDLVELGEDAGAGAHVGIAKTLQAVNLGLIADNWGAAPFSDAFTGETLTPEYDSAEEHYDRIFQLLDEAEGAFAGFDGTPSVRAGSDFIFGVTGDGDLAPWRRTISALRARYLNHLSETGDYNPNAVLAAADSAFSGFEQDAALATFQIRNPWAQVAENNDNLLLQGWLSAQFVDAVNGETFGTFDPRLPLLTDTTINGDYQGTVNGEGRRGDGTNPEESYLETSGYFSATDAPLDIITFAEVKFIEAEAALATDDQDRANEAFRAGVTASMTEIGVDSEAIDDYLSDAYGDDDVDRDDVFREKYVALFLHPETWVDARRYDYAYLGFEPATNAAIDGLPLRLQYPNSELDRNRRNTPTVTLSENLFWDQ